jgi:hypothetical protein
VDGVDPAPDGWEPAPLFLKILRLGRGQRVVIWTGTRVVAAVDSGASYPTRPGRWDGARQWLDW